MSAIGTAAGRPSHTRGFSRGRWGEGNDEHCAAAWSNGVFLQGQIDRAVGEEADWDDYVTDDFERAGQLIIDVPFAHYAGSTPSAGSSSELCTMRMSMKGVIHFQQKASDYRQKAETHCD